MRLASIEALLQDEAKKHGLQIQFVDSRETLKLGPGDRYGDVLNTLPEFDVIVDFVVTAADVAAKVTPLVVLVETVLKKVKTTLDRRSKGEVHYGHPDGYR